MDYSFGKIFMEKSQCKNLSQSDRDKKLSVPSPILPPSESAKIIKLPEPDFFEDKEVNFLELVEMRTSVRRYTGAKMSLKDLSYLLWCTQGIKMVSPNGTTTLRNVPSAGARHAFETYLLVHHVEDLATGLYRFLPFEHSLVEVSVADDMDAAMVEAFMHQPMISTSTVTFIWSAVLERMAYAYAERAYRYLHIDAGHVCQNLYLAAQSLNFGCCAIGHFDDEKLNQALKLDGEKQFAIYAATIGK